MATQQYSPRPPDRPDEVRIVDAVPTVPTVPTLPTASLVRALDAVTEAVIITDADGTVRFWNAAATALYGFTSPEAVGEPLAALILPLGRQPTGSSATPRHAAAELPAVSEWLTRDRQGRRFWVTASTCRLPPGNPGADPDAD